MASFFVSTIDTSFLPGQLFVRHSAMLVDEPEHRLPPQNGPYFDLERVLVPEPHVFEQDPHELQLLQ